MAARNDDRQGRAPLSPRDLLEFHPWMLALAVFLACAIGIALMEQVRDARDMWAAFQPQDDAGQHP
ncbi:MULTISPECIES: hypothetical protein [Anaeromyxobacter]|uniref:hypothetical protein n=1 Tax=Anaeromyxobacter TaxID=161492 RepID=UPI001F594082|nr:MULTISPECIES: hypothetical protein [unclassified Anaeromyxobacter]